MRKAAAAEWILSLTTSPDRAASTVGDLLEDAPARGFLWFWTSVLRTAFSHFFHDLCAYPLGTMKLAIWGLLAEVFLTWVLGSTIIVVWMRIIESLAPSGQYIIAVPDWGYTMVSYCIGYTFIPFLVGWMMARRSKGRELPAVFGLIFVGIIIKILALFLSSIQMQRIGQPYPFSEHPVLIWCLETLFLTAGAILFRLRILPKSKSA